MYPDMGYTLKQERRRYIPLLTSLLHFILTITFTPGVSLITQLSYLLVFCSRYLFLPLWSAYDRSEFHKFWNLTLKLFYIASSAYIVFIMMRVYARTREKEKAWKLGIGSLLGSAVAAPFIMLIMKSKAVWGFPEVRDSIHIISSSILTTAITARVDLLHPPRIHLHPPPTTPPPPNVRPNRPRLLLSQHTWLIPIFLRPQLAGTSSPRPRRRHNQCNIRISTNSALP